MTVTESQRYDVSHTLITLSHVTRVMSHITVTACNEVVI